MSCTTAVRPQVPPQIVHFLKADDVSYLNSDENSNTKTNTQTNTQTNTKTETNKGKT